MLASEQTDWLRSHNDHQISGKKRNAKYELTINVCDNVGLIMSQTDADCAKPSSAKGRAPCMLKVSGRSRVSQFNVNSHLCSTLC